MRLYFRPFAIAPVITFSLLIYGIIYGLSYGPAYAQTYPAPSFSELDATGKTITLNNLKGKWAVLEWYNKGCPYVKKHYGSGNMQKLQSDFSKKGVIWLSVISSKEGKQGYLTPPEALAHKTASGSQASFILLDSDGSMGKAFGAKTTPHIFLINPKGQVVYEGAIDSDDSTDADSIASAKNYLVEAYREASAGKPVTKAFTKAYGCSVKY